MAVEEKSPDMLPTVDSDAESKEKHSDDQVPAEEAAEEESKGSLKDYLVCDYVD
jgi:hypothetical protein